MTQQYLKFLIDRIPWPATRQGILRIALSLGIGSALLYALWPRKKRRRKRLPEKIPSKDFTPIMNSSMHKNMTMSTTTSMQDTSAQSTPKFALPRVTQGSHVYGSKIAASDNESMAASFTDASQLRYGVRFATQKSVDTQFAEDVNLMTTSGRKELFDCLTGMEKLVNCAQAAIESDSCQASQVTITSRNRNQSSHTINSQSATVCMLENFRDQITTVKSEIINKDSLPAVVPLRKTKMPSISAMSTLSMETDHWFSCSSGDITPPEIISYAKESEIRNLELYDKYLEKVSEIKFRKDRHQMVGCETFNEYRVCIFKVN